MGTEISREAGKGVAGMMHEFGSHVGLGGIYRVEVVGGGPLAYGLAMLARDHDTHVLFDSVVVEAEGVWKADLEAQRIDVSTDGGATWVGPIYPLEEAP